MKAINSIKTFAEFLRNASLTYTQSEYTALHKKLRDLYEQQLVCAFLEGHPSWSIVQGQCALLLFLYCNWQYSRSSKVNSRQMAGLAEMVECEFEDVGEYFLSAEEAKTTLGGLEDTYSFSKLFWKNQYVLVFLLPAKHKTEDSLCRCYRRADGTMGTDIFMVVPHKDETAAAQIVLLHEFGHIINIALTGDMNTQPADYIRLTNDLLGLDVSADEMKEFFAHTFAMSVPLAAELSGEDPFCCVPMEHKLIYQIYFQYKFKSKE